MCDRFKHTTVCYSKDLHFKYRHSKKLIHKKRVKKSLVIVRTELTIYNECACVQNGVNTKLSSLSRSICSPRL